MIISQYINSWQDNYSDKQILKKYFVTKHQLLSVHSIFSLYKKSVIPKNYY